MNDFGDVRFLRHGEIGKEEPAVIDATGRAFSLLPLTTDLDGDFLSADGVANARHALADEALPELRLAGRRIGPPVARPGKIVCVGLNYRDHAEETGLELPTEPVVFMKAVNTIVGPHDDVLIPRGSVKTDWEVELAVIVGATARYLPDEAAARQCVAGYCISNDVSEREFQLERGGQWDKGKSCESFQPLGPWLIPAEAIPDPQALSLKLSVNGVLRQDGNTANMIFGVDYLIWYLSQFMVLDPGDVINTGTPAGVALGLPGTPYLREGDIVELEIDGLGRQAQTFRQA